MNQLDWINKESERNQGDTYWDLAKGLTLQLKGMYRGYQKRIEIEGNKEESLKFENFYYLTNMGDLEDIIPAFDSQEINLKEKGFHECSGFIKLLKDELITSHNTHNM